MTWQSMDTAPKAMHVLIAYRNRQGKWRRIRACYFEAETLDSEYTESGFADAGWYESAEESEELAPVDGTPELWHPMPPLPEWCK